MSARVARLAGPAYRPDIDGLRALAVLAVVAFHAFPQAVRGGFVGVDVFFVISGYLITRTIVQEADAGPFSFSAFYARRARRIFPALVVALLATLALSALVLPAHEREQVGQHVVAGALFSSNFLLWHEAGYFDAASASKPLLHLWSLGIEEQFYVAWPAILVAVSRVRRFRLHAVVAIASASFVISVLTTGANPTAAFYSPASRAWELMAGAMLGMLPDLVADGSRAQRWRNASSFAGTVLLLGAIAGFNAAMPFPGWRAMVPTMGTVLIIGAGPGALISRRLFAHRMPVLIGLISYPLYLWHWPLLVLARRVMRDFAFSPGQSTAGVILVVIVSLLAAYATYRLCELPLRRRAAGPVAVRASLALAATAMLGAVVLVPTSELDRDALIAEKARNDWATPKSQDAVYFVSASHTNPEIVFVGDSHTEQYYPAVKRAIEAQSPIPVVAFSTHGGCPFLPTYRVALCGAPYRRSMQLASLPSVRRVVITSAWDMYSTDGHPEEVFRMTPADMHRIFPLLMQDVMALRQRGKEVVIIGPHPYDERADPELLAAHTRLGRFGTRAPTRFAHSFPLSEFRQRTAMVRELLADLAAKTGAVAIDPAVALCPAGACLTMDAHGTPIRKDSNHLRPFAAIQYLTFVPALVAPGPIAAAPPLSP